LGATLAEFLAAQGYDLILTARGEADLQKTTSALSKYHGSLIALSGDVTNAAHRRKLAEAASKLGQLNLLVNNASELGSMPHLAEYPLESLEQVLAVNLLAPVALIQEALPLLKKSQGLVVNMSSDAAVAGYPNWGGYGASKAALDLVSLTLANELHETGVGVVSVDPGDMRTDMHQQAFPDEDISDRPLPDVTLPFWAWLLGQDPLAVSGGRYKAQAEQWEPVS
jgi:NAD(P)-dependent dehydrogenase (short-subunit alcohol dehydrogenase family)